MTHILITGATGYIGGSILEALLSHSESNSFSITAVVRDFRKANALRELGIRVVVGSHANAALIEPLAEDADVVITAANADDLDAANAILRGMKRKYEHTSVAPILIQTSGTGVLADDARGEHGTDIIYSDMDIPLLDSLPPSQPHRVVDLAVLEADRQGYVRAWIVIPSTIYGRASGLLVERGISNPKSQQIPRLVDISLRRGQAAMVGRGENFWPNVNINDLTDLYMLLFDKVRSSSALVHGREGLYFGANGEHKLKEIYQRLGENMVALGKARSPKPSPLTDKEIALFFGPPPSGVANANLSYGSNSRARADRGYALGWKPTKTTQDMLLSIRMEMELSTSEV